MSDHEVALFILGGIIGYPIGIIVGGWIYDKWFRK